MHEPGSLIRGLSDASHLLVCFAPPLQDVPFLTETAGCQRALRRGGGCLPGPFMLGRCNTLAGPATQLINMIVASCASSMQRAAC